MGNKMDFGHGALSMRTQGARGIGCVRILNINQLGLLFGLVLLSDLGKKHCGRVYPHITLLLFKYTFMPTINLLHSIFVVWLCCLFSICSEF